MSLPDAESIAVGRPRRTRGLSAGAGALLAGALLYFVGRSFWRQAGRLHEIDWTLRPLPLLLSFSLLLVGYVLLCATWHRLLTGFGVSLPGSDARRVWFVAQLGKYVPGRVWAAAGRVYLLRRAGVSPIAGSASVLYDALLMTLAALALAALTLPAWSRAAGERASEGLPLLLGLVGAAFLGMLALFHPRVWALAMRVARVSDGVASPPRPRLASLAGLLLAYLGCWAVIGAGFDLLVLSLHPVPPTSWVGLGGVFVFSWAAGNLVFLVPAGLGVREGVLLLYLGQVLPPPIAAVVVIGSRLWTMSADLVGAAVFGLGRRGHAPSTGS